MNCKINKGPMSLTKNICEAIIDEKVVEYHVASGNTLEKAKKFYGPDYEYIGTGHIWSIDGKLQGVEPDEPQDHFFIYKPKNPQQ